MFWEETKEKDVSSVTTLFAKQDKPTSDRNECFSICQLYFKAMVVYPTFPREQDPPLTLWTIVIDAGSPPPLPPPTGTHPNPPPPAPSHLTRTEALVTVEIRLADIN